MRRDPIHAGRFHHNRFRSGRDQPVGHAFQIAGKCPECLDRLVAQVWADGGDMKSQANIDTGCEWMNDRQAASLDFERSLGMTHLLDSQAGRGLRIEQLPKRGRQKAPLNTRPQLPLDQVF